MDFTYDDEQNALRDAVRGLLTKAYGDFEQRRQTTKADPGFSEKTWTQMAEMGLLGLPFSEDDGGVGAGGGAIRPPVRGPLARRRCRRPYRSSREASPVDRASTANCWRPAEPDTRHRPDIRP